MEGGMEGRGAREKKKEGKRRALTTGGPGEKRPMPRTTPPSTLVAPLARRLTQLKEKSKWRPHRAIHIGGRKRPCERTVPRIPTQWAGPEFLGPCFPTDGQPQQPNPASTQSWRERLSATRHVADPECRGPSTPRRSASSVASPMRPPRTRSATTLARSARCASARPPQSPALLVATPRIAKSSPARPHGRCRDACPRVGLLNTD